MSDFTIIETQEQFDAAIQKRIDRNTKTVTEEVSKLYEGYISPDDFTAKTADFTKQIEELTAQLTEKDKSIADITAQSKAHEISSVKMKVALESGLPFELAERLSGDNEEEIRVDAEKLAKYTARAKSTPIFTSQTPPDDKNSALKSMLSELKGGN